MPTKNSVGKMMKRMKYFSLPLLLVMSTSYAADKAVFDFHNHTQIELSHNQWDNSQQGIKLVVTASDELNQDGNGFGVVDDHANGELDGKEGHNDVMTFKFFDERTQKPLNVVIKKLTVKMFEPKVARDIGKLVQLDGTSLATLNSSMSFQGTSGFGKDRHINNSWSLKGDVEVEGGFTLTPGANSGFYVYALEVEAMNMPVVFTSLPVASAPEGLPYVYPIKFFDEDLSAVELTLSQAPEGMTLDPITATLNWQPNFKAQGQYPITITANDSEGLVTTQLFTLDIVNTNQAPDFVSVPVITGKENFPYSYKLQAFDKDQDSTFLKLVSGPVGMTLNEENQIIQWTPNFHDAGLHEIVLSVSDVYDEKLQNFQLSIEDNNRLPTITSEPESDGQEGLGFVYSVKASDPDKDALAYELIYAPKGMSVDAQTGLLKWTPGFQQAGQHFITLQVDDGKQGLFKQKFEIDVENINRAPKIVSQPVKVAKENSPYRYRINVQDDDLDGVILSLDDGPEGMKLDSVSNSLYWSPNFDDEGNHSVVVVASDGEDEIEQTYQLTVNNVNRSPTLQMVKEQALIEGNHFDLQLNADDLDNSDLAFQLVQGPKGMVLGKDDARIHWQAGFDQAGVHQVRVKTVDEENAEHELEFLINVNNINRKPKITTNPVLIGLENQQYFYNFSAHDEDEDILTYKLLSAPEGMKIEGNNGYVSWTPNFNKAGNYEVALAVSDGFNEVSQIFNLDILNSNRAPKIISKPVLKIAERQAYQYTLKSRDADHEVMEYTLLSAPEGMLLDKVSKQIIWRPDWHQAGLHQVTVQVQDPHDGRDIQTFNLNVLNKNRAPQLSIVRQTEVFENQDFHYQIDARDADDDRLKYKMISAPKGMKFDSYTHTLSWRPGFKHAGKHEVKVSVSDGKNMVSQNFTLKVKDKNRLPKFNSVAPSILNEGQEYQYKIRASDLDTDELKYSLIMSPEGMNVDERTGLINWKSNFEDAGQHGIEVLVEDGKGGNAIQAYRLFVKNINRKPKFTSEPVVKAKLGQPYRYQLLAKDDDWNVLSFNLITAPEDLRLDKQTHTLYWDKDKMKAGIHKVVVTLSDGNEALNQEFNIAIKSKDDMSSDL
ncbi:MAG: putative Ig domain-containing protein [Bermanella sp.]